MPKYYRSRGYRRRYRKRSTPARRYARTQAKTALQYSKQKFTTVYDIRYAANEETYGNTISLIGGKGVTPSIAAGITTLSNVNNDQVLTSQMTLHQ